MGKEGLFHRTGKEIQNVFQNLFKQRGKWRRKAAELDGYYTDDAPRAVNSTKWIVCMIDGRTKHGGLADRLRGIVSTYYVSKKLGYDFRLHFVHPFWLTDYLVPNSVDWRVRSDELCYNRQDSQVMYCGSNATLVEPFFQELWFKKCMRAANKQLHVYTNAHLLPRGRKFGQCFNELFRPSEALQQAIAMHSKPLNGGYYAMTFRFQQIGRASCRERV